MQVHVSRDPGTQPGRSTWLDLGGELVFVVSAAGVSALGAQALEQAWDAFIGRGRWVYGGDGARISAHYHRQEVEPGDVVRVTCRGDGAQWRVDCYLSPEHFAAASVVGLEREARDSIRCGWRYVAAVPARKAAA